MSDKQDNLFAKSRAVTSGFRFDEQVVKVFPDMIARSVPGYELVVPMVGMLARRYSQPDSQIYDLGYRRQNESHAAVSQELAAYAPAMRDWLRSKSPGN